jgi:hypothetical protein
MMDPSIAISAMAAVTTNLAFGTTASTSFEQPFLLAKRFSTLDHLTAREREYGKGQAKLRDDHTGSRYKYDVYQEKRPYHANSRSEPVVEAVAKRGAVDHAANAARLASDPALEELHARLQIVPSIC